MEKRGGKTPNGPRLAQNSLRLTQNSPKLPQNGLRLTQNSPKWPQIDPKSPQNSPKSLKLTLNPKMHKSGGEAAPARCFLPFPPFLCPIQVEKAAFWFKMGGFPLFRAPVGGGMMKCPKTGGFYPVFSPSAKLHGCVLSGQKKNDTKTARFRNKNGKNINTWNCECFGVKRGDFRALVGWGAVVGGSEVPLGGFGVKKS